MTRPYSEDIRERTVAGCPGETVRSIAEALQISPSCVTKWKNLRRETGGVSPAEIGGHKKRVLSGANADCETWIKTNMAPLRGWGPRGQRVRKTMTFIAALRRERISAPWVIVSPINGELFTLYVEKVLAPTLAMGEVVTGFSATSG